MRLSVPYEGGGSIRLYSVSGREVLNRKFTGRGLNIPLELPVGVYIYAVESGGKIFRGKVMNFR